MLLYLLKFDFLGKNDKIVNILFIILFVYMGVIKFYIFVFLKDVKKLMFLYVYLFDFVFFCKKKCYNC